MSHAASEINAGTLRRGDVVGRGKYQGGANHQAVRWVPEMNKGQSPSKPAQVQFAREVQAERDHQDVTTTGPKHQHNHHNRKNYQRSKTAISPDNVINGTYSIGKKLGEGSFGVIYQGTNILSKELVAIKFEPKKTDAPQLADEHRFYNVINPAIGFPKCYHFGREGPYSVLCIELLGPSLEDLFDLCGRKFSVKTVCMAAKQMLARVWTIHENKYIYRDIKPDNFLIGRVSNVPELHFGVYDSAPAPPNLDRKIVDYYRSLQGRILSRHAPENPHPASLIYIVDFGMAKQYYDPFTQSHIPYREKKSLSGTARYMSINTHLGIEQSRRDDLEALGHVLMYFLRGSLPWQGLRGATNKQKYEKIGGKKQSTLIRSLCAGYPKEFETYLAYTRSLKFSETPNYSYLIGLFDSVLEKIGEKDDGIFDWMVEMDRQAEKTQLRENAWKRRDERENSNVCKSWQDQYYNALLHKQDRPIRSQILPRQTLSPSFPPPSFQYGHTSQAVKIPQKNLAQHNQHQPDHNQHYIQHRDHATLLQKKRSAALGNYRVNSGHIASGAADRIAHSAKQAGPLHSTSSKLFYSSNGIQDSADLISQSFSRINGAVNYKTPAQNTRDEIQNSPPPKDAPSYPDAEGDYQHQTSHANTPAVQSTIPPQADKITSGPSIKTPPHQTSSPIDIPQPRLSQSATPSAPPSSTDDISPHKLPQPDTDTRTASATTHKDLTTSQYQADPPSPKNSAPDIPSHAPNTCVNAVYSGISTDEPLSRSQTSKRKSTTAGTVSAFASGVSRLNKSFIIFKKDGSSRSPTPLTDRVPNPPPATARGGSVPSFLADPHQGEGIDRPGYNQRGAENTQKSQKSPSKLKDALRSKWRKLFKK